MGTYTGTSGSNTLHGRDGVADDIFGFDGDDFLFGHGGDDWLYGGRGADALFGGTGTDTASYSDSDRGVNVNLATRRGFGGTAEGDTLFDIENLYGSNHYDILTGNEQANTIYAGDGGGWIKGGGGADTLWGSHGVFDDFLDGGTGVDTMRGGRGNDTYYVDHWDDVVVERWSEGNDRVLASVTYALPPGAHVETVATINPDGTADINLWGNEFSNTVIGNDGDNQLVGLGSDDTLIGHGGDDSYFIENVGDTIIERAGEGYDKVGAGRSYTLPEGADVEELWAFFPLYTHPVDLTGNSSGNVVKGNYGNNIINGGDGDDQLWGLDGNDTFLFNTPLNVEFNVDEIADFEVADDVIHLDMDVFRRLEERLVGSNLEPEEFVVGPAAVDGDDYIIYDSTTGDLSYDGDGNGPGAAILFARLNPGLALTHLDFVVV
jgi:Ca2+-binding RTX toxin-like protein